MELIVHIGTPKTGTTSVQELLFKNRAALNSQGFHFLQCAGERNNRELAVYSLRDDVPDEILRWRGIRTPEQRAAFRDGLKERLQEELSSLGDSIHTVIVSSEQLSARLNHCDEVGRFQSLVSPHFSDIRILVWLREQCNMATSRYSTAVRSGVTLGFRAFMNDCHPGNPLFNYLDLLDRWADVFGRENITPRVFHRDHFVQGDLLSDFIAAIEPKLLHSLEFPLQQNTSIRPLGQLILLMTNRFCKTFYKGNMRNRKKFERRARISDAVEERLSGPGLQPSARQYKRIFELFADSNREVNQRYFGRDGDLFIFEPPH
jgi:hypothetical protein